MERSSNKKNAGENKYLLGFEKTAVNHPEYVLSPLSFPYLNLSNYFSYVRHQTNKQKRKTTHKQKKKSYAYYMDSVQNI